MYIEKKTKSCVACSYKNSKKYHPFLQYVKILMSWPALMPPLKPIEVIPKPFWRVHVDVLGPLEMSINGNQYVAVGVCALLKYVEASRN